MKKTGLAHNKTKDTEWSGVNGDKRLKWRGGGKAVECFVRA